MSEFVFPFYHRTSGFISPATLRVGDGKVYLSAKRIKPKVFTIFRLVSALSVVVVLVLVISSLVLMSQSQEGNESLAIIFTIVSIVLLIILSATMVVIRLWIRRRHSYQHEVTFPLEAVSKVRVGYNWDTGCALWILLSPLVALPYLLISGRKIIKITAPFERGGTESVTYALKAPNKTEATRLMEALQSNK